MKKYFALIISLILSIFVLAACGNGNLVNEDSFNNYTLNIYTNLENGYTSETLKVGSKYKISNNTNEEAAYYGLYNSKVFKYTTKYVEFGEEKLKSASSAIDSSIDPAKLEKLLKALTKADVKDGSLVNLVNNSIVSSIIESVVLTSDKTVNLGTAYKNGLIKLDSAKVDISKSRINKIECSFPYGGETVVVTAEFKDYGTTEIQDFPVETSYDKTYYSYFDANEEGQKPKSVYIDVKFGDYGTVRFESLVLENDAEVNALNYFLYLYKKGAYKKATVNSATSSILLIGDQAESITKTIASKVSKNNSPSNKRGTFALKFTDDSSNPSQQFQINLTDLSSSYDSTSTVIAGCISGFDTLDAISQLTTDIYSTLDISIKVTYNDFEYTEPTFKN